MVKVIFERNWDLSYGLGFEVYFHKHKKREPLHMHIIVVLLGWFIEIRIGKDCKGEKDED